MPLTQPTLQGTTRPGSAANAARGQIDAAVSKLHRSFQTPRTQTEPSQQYPTTPGQPIAGHRIKTRSPVDGHRRYHDRLDLLGLGPGRARQVRHLTIRIDDSRYS